MPSISTSFLIALLRASGDGLVMIWVCNEQNGTLSTIMSKIYRKIPKISPGAYISQRPFLRGLFLEGLICGGKLAFQNQLG